MEWQTFNNWEDIGEITADSSMFWWLKKKRQQIPGLTGTGDFIYNISSVLWDDLSSPGLINMDRFFELHKAALLPEEHARLSSALIENSIVDDNGRYFISPEEKLFVQRALKKVSAYLSAVRDSDFEKLGYWLSDNFMLHKDGWIKDQHESNIGHDILRVVSAYLNCLNHWGFRYSWKEIRDSSGEPALLISRNEHPEFSLRQSDVLFIQGKPYRFVIEMKTSAWQFDSSGTCFTIKPRNGSPLLF